MNRFGGPEGHGDSLFEPTSPLALFISAVLGVVSESTDRERLMYCLRSFGWLMWFGCR